LTPAGGEACHGATAGLDIVVRRAAVWQADGGRPPVHAGRNGKDDRVAQISSWVVGAMLGFLGFVGLLISSRAHDEVMYWVGLGVFVFSVLVIFGLIKEAFEHG